MLEAQKAVIGGIFNTSLSTLNELENSVKNEWQKSIAISFTLALIPIPLLVTLAVNRAKNFALTLDLVHDIKMYNYLKTIE